MAGPIRRLVATAAVILFSAFGVLAIGPASATSTWGTAQEVAISLNTRNNAQVSSISCSSAGNCSAGGYYRDSAGQQAFVIDEVGGHWGDAQEVAISLNTQNNASVDSISCSSAGTCSAGGDYQDLAGVQAFVVDEVGGHWGDAQEVAASLNTGNYAQVISISCSSAGNCSAGGLYNDGAGVQAFVVEATAPVTPTTTVPTTVPATPTTTVPATLTTTPLTTTPAMTTSATLAATGANLTLPLGLAAVFLGLGGLGVLRLQRRRQRM